METHNVIKVRKERPVLNPDHEHIVGVVTEDGAYHSIQEVVDSIRLGHLWQTSVAGENKNPIRIDLHCPHSWCLHQPYLSTATAETLATDLERLPRG